MRIRHHEIVGDPHTIARHNNELILFSDPMLNNIRVTADNLCFSRQRLVFLVFEVAQCPR